MRTINLTSLDSSLVLEISFQGQMNLVYLLRLFEPDKNTIVEERSGESTGAIVTYTFPEPLSANNERIAVIKFRFRGLDIANSPKYVIKAEVIQNGTILSTETRSEDFTGTTQNAQISVKINLM